MERDDKSNAAERAATGRTVPDRAHERRNREWSRITQTSAFRQLIQKKKAFVASAAIFFLVFYMLMPVLAGFTTVLDGQAIGAITWAYIYGFAQFPMVWILCHLYRNRANRWDELAEEARREASEGTTPA